MCIVRFDYYPCDHKIERLDCFQACGRPIAGEVAESSLRCEQDCAYQLAIRTPITSACPKCDAGHYLFINKGLPPKGKRLYGYDLFHSEVRAAGRLFDKEETGAWMTKTTVYEVNVPSKTKITGKLSSGCSQTDRIQAAAAAVLDRVANDDLTQTIVHVIERPADFTVQNKGKRPEPTGDEGGVELAEALLELKIDDKSPGKK